MNPLVSVIMPVYNGERHLKEAIDSVLQQTYRNIELVIIDDGSTDSSARIIAQYEDTRIKYYKNEQNLRIVKTLNKAIEKSAGTLIARMDADDICLPERIERQAAYLTANPQVALIDTIMEYIDEHGELLHKYNNNIIDAEEIRLSLPKFNCLGHSSIMTRSSVYNTYKYRQIDYEDYDMWLRLINDGKIIHKIDAPLLLYRIHSASITGAAQINNRHFYKLSISMLFYFRQLPLLQKIKPFNLKVLYYACKAYLLWVWKKIKLK